MAHDQSFKKLILDYPQQALRAPGSSEDRGRRPLLRDGRLVGATCGRDQGVA